MSPHVSPGRLLPWPSQGNPKCELCNVRTVWQRERWCEVCYEMMERMGGRMVEFKRSGSFQQPEVIAAGERIEAWVRRISPVETKYGERIVWEFEDNTGALYTGWTGTSLNQGRAAQYVQGILGADAATAHVVNSDLMVGMPVTIVGGLNQNGRPIVAEVWSRPGDPKDFDPAGPDVF